MKIGLLLSKENIRFSLKEAKSLFGEDGEEAINNVFLTTVHDLQKGVENVHKAGFAKKAFLILVDEETVGDMQKKVEQLNVVDHAFPGSTYKIDSLTVGEHTGETDRGLLAGLLNTTGELVVDVENPDEEFIHIKGERHVFAQAVPIEDQKFEQRKANNLPAPHPTAMSPRTARAMINIAKPEKAVTDPFSGAGGILLEASLLGYTANGIDFDTRMIERAKENLSAFDSEANLKHGNALETEWPDGVIVTDVPYGKNSAVSEGADALFKNFVQRMKAENRTGVVCYPKRVETVNTVKKVYGEVESYDFYVNKSLTRRISVLR